MDVFSSLQVSCTMLSQLAVQQTVYLGNHRADGHTAQPCLCRAAICSMGGLDLGMLWLNTLFPCTSTRPCKALMACRMVTCLRVSQDHQIHFVHCSRQGTFSGDAPLHISTLAVKNDAPLAKGCGRPGTCSHHQTCAQALLQPTVQTGCMLFPTQAFRATLAATAPAAV